MKLIKAHSRLFGVWNLHTLSALFQAFSTWKLPSVIPAASFTFELFFISVRTHKPLHFQEVKPELIDYVPNGEKQRKLLTSVAILHCRTSRLKLSHFWGKLLSAWRDTYLETEWKWVGRFITWVLIKQWKFQFRTNHSLFSRWSVRSVTIHSNNNNLDEYVSAWACAETDVSQRMITVQQIERPVLRTKSKFDGHPWLIVINARAGSGSPS